MSLECGSVVVVAVVVVVVARTREDRRTKGGRDVLQPARQTTVDRNEVCEALQPYGALWKTS